MTTEHTISTETIRKHKKELSFHASPYPNERPHTMAIYIDGFLDQYVSLSDDAIDSIIEKREAMRVFISSQREE